MNDQVYITEPTAEQIFFNITGYEKQFPDTLYGYENNHEIHGIIWSIEVDYSSPQNFDFICTMQKSEDNPDVGCWFTIEVNKDDARFLINNASEYLDGTFLEVVTQLAKLQKEHVWAQYALMALEVPLEEIEDAA